MSSSVLRALLLTASLFVVGCGSGVATTESVVVEESVNVDSLLDVMAVRYDALCEERKEAYGERDAELRRQLLERNDARCRALDDSLRWVLSLR